MSWRITPSQVVPDDADAATYVAAVEAADGEALEPAVRLAINSFVKGCKADGIWPAIKASCILAGARTLAGALTPLVGTAPSDYGFWGAADPQWSNVSLLLRMDGANGSTTIVDSSNNNYTITRAGGIQLLTNQSVTGGSSLYSDGSADYLTFNNAAVAFGVDDFTIEFWLKLETNTVTYPYIFSSSAYDAGGGFYIVVNGPATGWGGIGLLSFDGSSGSNGASLQSTSSVRDGSWHHIAITRSGANHYLFIDGNEEAQASAASANYTGTGACVLGAITSGTSVSNISSDKGWMDELRVTKGYCRYTSNFTPSTRSSPAGVADYNRTTGLVGDGSTKYLNSNRNNNADPQNSFHVSAYMSYVGTSGYALGCGAGEPGYFLMGTTLTAPAQANRSNSDYNLTSAPIAGLIAHSRSNSSTFVIRHSSLNTEVSRTSQSPANLSILVYCRGTPASPAVYSNARLAFYSIGESLDLALLDTRVTALINAFAAAIP